MLLTEMLQDMYSQPTRPPPGSRVGVYTPFSNTDLKADVSPFCSVRHETSQSMGVACNLCTDGRRKGAFVRLSPRSSSRRAGGKAFPGRPQEVAAGLSRLWRQAPGSVMLLACRSKNYLAFVTHLQAASTSCRRLNGCMRQTFLTSRCRRR